jgi:hypothetical protein
MGKKIRLYEAQLKAANKVIEAKLRARSRVRTGPGFIGAYSEFSPFYQAKIEAYRDRALRTPELWRCRLRSRSPERRFLELVRFAFARYRVAGHLERIWIEERHAFANRVGVPAGRIGGDLGSPDLCLWYIVAAQGGSLYKQLAHPFMSKLETHHFLTAPKEVASSQHAFWYAFARAQGADLDVALRIARTRLTGFPVVMPFWKDVARYFACNPIAIPEMNDLIDFFQAAKEEDEEFSLKGRSLAVLRRRMAEWHHTLRRRDIVCGGSWEGHPLPDIEYETGGEHRRAIWRFKQIKTGNDLFKEGQRMHHCVVTYKARCMNGHTSIWSLNCEFPIGNINRGVTIEVQDNAIVQCRGFANRLPYANEVSMVKLWAAGNGLTWRAIER